jgi:hypothetical protein
MPPLSPIKESLKLVYCLDQTHFSLSKLSIATLAEPLEMQQEAIEVSRIKSYGKICTHKHMYTHSITDTRSTHTYIHANTCVHVYTHRTWTHKGKQTW